MLWHDAEAIQVTTEHAEDYKEKALSCFGACNRQQMVCIV